MKRVSRAALLLIIEDKNVRARDGKRTESRVFDALERDLQLTVDPSHSIRRCTGAPSLLRRLLKCVDRIRGDLGKVSKEKIEGEGRVRSMGRNDRSLRDATLITRDRFRS